MYYKVVIFDNEYNVLAEMRYILNKEEAIKLGEDVRKFYLNIGYEIVGFYFEFVGDE